MKKSVKAIVGGIVGLAVLSGAATFALAAPGMNLKSSFAKSNATERLSQLAGGEWNFEKLVCPYSTAEFTRSEFLGLSGHHSKYIDSDSNAAITYRTKNSDDVFIITFSRTTAFDPCSSQ